MPLRAPATRDGVRPVPRRGLADVRAGPVIAPQLARGGEVAVGAPAEDGGDVLLQDVGLADLAREARRPP